jgi:hypothetical protein
MSALLDASRLCIVSGRFPPTEFQSSWNHRAYANRHGYTYIHCNWPALTTNPYMVKFHFIREYVRHFEYIFWIDDDAFFIDLDKALTSFMPGADKFASFCKSPSNKAIFTYLSSGQFLLRGNSIGAAFVEAVLSTSIEHVKAWWRDDLGMFTKGDQDAIVYLLHEDERFRGGVQLFDYVAFNSRLGDLEVDPEAVFLLHFTGPRERKRADHARAARLLGRGPSLLPSAVEGKFSHVHGLHRGSGRRSSRLRFLKELGHLRFLRRQ